MRKGQGLKAVEDPVSDFNRMYTTTYWSELLERMLAEQGSLPNNESWSWPPIGSITVVRGRVRHSKSESMVTCIKLGSGYP